MCSFRKSQRRWWQLDALADIWNADYASVLSHPKAEFHIPLLFCQPLWGCKLPGTSGFLCAQASDSSSLRAVLQFAVQVWAVGSKSAPELGKGHTERVEGVREDPGRAQATSTPASHWQFPCRCPGDKPSLTMLLPWPFWEAYCKFMKL